jgi:hypothetical protein
VRLKGQHRPALAAEIAGQEVLPGEADPTTSRPFSGMPCDGSVALAGSIAEVPAAAVTRGLIGA